VMRPQHSPHCLAAEPGGASVVGKRQTPAADPVLPAIDDRPADAAGAGNNHAAIPSPVRPDAGGVRVAGDNGMTEWQAPRPGRRQFGRLGRAGEREAGNYASHRVLAQPRLGEALPGGIQHGGESGIQPEADIGRPAGPFAEHPPRPVGEPRPALRPAAIDAEKEIALWHALLLTESLPNWLNASKV